MKKLKYNGIFFFTALLLMFFVVSCNKKAEDKNIEQKVEDQVSLNYEVPTGSENWPAFRGVNASGITKDQNLPLKWDAKTGENILWTYQPPGLGLSAPVIWEDRVFLTTAVDQIANDSNLRIGLYGDVASVKGGHTHTWELICLNRKNGEVIWKKEVFKGIPKVKRHTKSSHANSTTATDGKHILAFFGSEGLYCYNFEGELLWKRDFGILDSGFYRMPEAQWEFASSPVIHKDKVIIQVDVQKNSFVAALNIKTGETIWKTDRDEVPTWSTPTVFEGKTQTQVILNGYKQISSYNLNDGKPVWWMAGGGDIPVPTPIIGFNKVYITNSHGRARPIFAINLTATGDISLKDKETSNQHIAWAHLRKGAYMPTPILYGDHFYLVRNNGIMLCLDAQSGKEIYKKRVGSMQSAYCASPVAADGKIYFADEYGDIHVVKAGTEFKLLSTNKLYESCLSTPAISGQTLFIRTIDHLFAIGKGGKTSGIKIREEKTEPEEKIDFTKLKTDGSISNPQKLMKILTAKLKAISSVKYHIKAIGTESEADTMGTFESEAILFRTAGRMPEYFMIKGKHFGTDKTIKKDYLLGSDGNEFYYMDKTNNSIKKGVEFADAGKNFSAALNPMLINDFVSKTPLSVEKTAKEIKIKPLTDVNGQKCYEIYFKFPQYNNYEITWFISTENFMPLKKKMSYAMRGGKRGGFVQTLSKIEINQHQKAEFFKIPKSEN